MSTVFLIALEENPYSGVVRPFLNWAKALKGRAIVVIYRCSSNLECYVRDSADLTGFGLITNKSFHRLVTKLRHYPVDYLISDDYMPRLELLLKSSGELGAKCAVYSQVLYGIHSLVRTFDSDLLDLKTRMLFSMASAIPFKILSARFKALLEKANTVVANSRLTMSMLELLYAIEPAGIVYPSVDTDVFRPTGLKADDEEVLVYLGSNPGDTKPQLVQRLLGKLSKHAAKIHLLGNEEMYRKYVNKGINHLYHKELTDKQLAKLYSKIRLTLAPQLIEFFGLVPVESLSCGTPVLTRYPHEALCNEHVGKIAYNDEDFLEKAASLLSNQTSEEIRGRCREIALRFSIETSKSSLFKTLGKQ